jgi:hypothetical protein
MEHRLKHICYKINIKNPYTHWFICTLLVLIVFSCKSPKSKLAEYGPVFENVMRSDVGVFRGFSLGDRSDSIQKKETGKPIEVDSGYLYYEYKLSTGSFNITYNFDERGLNEIQSDIFITNADDADKIFNTFKTYFDQHYGANQNQMGFSAWSVKSEKFGDVKINLSDESANFSADKAPGKISLWIYRDKI